MLLFIFLSYFFQKLVNYSVNYFFVEMLCNNTKTKERRKNVGKSISHRCDCHIEGKDSKSKGKIWWGNYVPEDFTIPVISQLKHISGNICAGRDAPQNRWCRMRKDARRCLSVSREQRMHIQKFFCDIKAHRHAHQHIH